MVKVKDKRNWVPWWVLDDVSMGTLRIWLHCMGHIRQRKGGRVSRDLTMDFDMASNNMIVAQQDNNTINNGLGSDLRDLNNN